MPKKFSPNPDFSGRVQPADALEYILAGNAVLTIRDSETGLRFTYLVHQPSTKVQTNGQAWPHFVRVLSGPDNTRDYHLYVGTIFDRTTFKPSKRQGPGFALESSQSTRLFLFVWHRLQKDVPDLPERIELWHEGYCGRCGRLLTVPESVERGIGPVCAGLMGL